MQITASIAVCRVPFFRIGPLVVALAVAPAVVADSAPLEMPESPVATPAPPEAAPPAPAVAVEHTLFDQLLREHVVAGLVNYAAIKTDPRLDAYLAILADADLAAIGDRDSRLAFWINAYNAITLRLVADHYPVKSIRDIPHPGVKSPWDLPVALVGGRRFTLNDIEHRILRDELKEPRIHFAVVCAAKSCPALRNEAFTPGRLDLQLGAQARAFLATKNRFDPVTRKAELSPIFSWFASDFGADPAQVLGTLAPYTKEAVGRSLLEVPNEWTVTYPDYDWSLNDRR